MASTSAQENAVLSLNIVQYIFIHVGWTGPDGVWLSKSYSEKYVRNTVYAIRINLPLSFLDNQFEKERILLWLQSNVSLFVSPSGWNRFSLQTHGKVAHFFWSIRLPYTYMHKVIFEMRYFGPFKNYKRFRAKQHLESAKFIKEKSA